MLLSAETMEGIRITGMCVCMYIYIYMYVHMHNIYSSLLTCMHANICVCT